MCTLSCDSGLFLPTYLLSHIGDLYPSPAAALHRSLRLGLWRWLQATMWSMPELLKDVSVPVDWMRPLRISNLNLWLGDGLFHNTVHYDPDDNVLCLIHGTRLRQAVSSLRPPGAQTPSVSLS